MRIFALHLFCDEPERVLAEGLAMMMGPGLTLGLPDDDKEVA